MVIPAEMALHLPRSPIADVVAVATLGMTRYPISILLTVDASFSAATVVPFSMSLKRAIKDANVRR
jgi:hypothetical protein